MYFKTWSFLKAPTDGFSEGCKAISRQLREHPSRYYVNVHNDPYSDGAIRASFTVTGRV